MLERLIPVLRLVCIALGGLILYQVVQVLAHKDPLENLSVAAAYSMLDAAEAPATSPGTNTVAPGTNAISGTNRVRATNMPAARAAVKSPGDLPPAVQARIDRITQSEMLGPVIRPLPMALIGIAGKDVLLRAANGQTGLLREGEELGGVKLLRIGTNRVLVEHEQQQQELTVFSGVGGESLLPKADKKPQ